MLDALLLLAAATTLSVPANRPGWFVCDGIDRPLVVLAGKPDPSGQALFTLVDKAGGRTRSVRYQVGRADPGAGQVYYVLSQGGREVGNVHMVNPRMIDPPAAASTPPVTSVTIGEVTTQCRWLESTRLDGVTTRRGVAITREAGGLTYRTFDFARPPGRPVMPDGVQRMAAPSLVLRGGSEVRTAGGARRFRFANRPWSYVIAIDARGQGELVVQRSGRAVQRERFLGLTLAD